MDRSASAEVVVVVVSWLFELFGSAVLETTVAVFESTVPGARSESTFTATLMVSLSPAAMDAFLHWAAPDSKEHAHPDGPFADWKVVPEGMASFMITWFAVSGPLFSTRI